MAKLNIKEILMNFFSDKNYKPLSFKELCVIFEIEKDMRNEFSKVLKNLEDEGRIIKDGSKYGMFSNTNVNQFVGVIDGNEKGFGFFVSEDEDMEDMFVRRDDLNGALDGDKVIVKKHDMKTDYNKDEAYVVKILERANEKIVGNLQINRTFGFVVPDNSKLGCDVFVAGKNLKGANTDDKVVVEVTKWPSKDRRNAEGYITEVLGKSDEPKAVIDGMLIKDKIRVNFGRDVIKEIEEIKSSIDVFDKKERKDLTELDIITIDGADSKDLDDAVSLEMNEKGNYILGVHIADVSHYVKDDSAIDAEALKRGNSVYLADRVIPMLPRKLSNGVCSLNPNEIKLTLSCTMEIDSQGKVVDYEIYESFIKTKYRMTYTDVADVLENKNMELTEKYSDILDMLQNMYELSKILKIKRQDRGCIDFFFPETKIILDDDGRVDKISTYDIRISNKIIEEFMLVCNETVAESYYWLELPFVYRIHEDPSQDDVDQFLKFIAKFGYFIKGSQEIHPREFQKLLKEIKGKKEEAVITTLMLRSLKKAIYSLESGDHFGLAAEYYCHFTSPIRRYPDLQIHRIIKKNINGKINKKNIEKLASKCSRVADHASRTERKADEIERDTNKVYMADYMRDYLGDEFDAVISGVTKFGVFVELPNTVEGLVHISDLNDDMYDYNDESRSLIGRHSNKQYSFGDPMKVKLVRVSVSKAQIDFCMA